jgi:hypothetical protein
MQMEDQRLDSTKVRFLPGENNEIRGGQGN